MGYHISCLLSLHKVFSGHSQSPVPSFLVIDQPSQVYFPTGREFDEDVGEVSGNLTNDESRLRGVFQLLAEFVQASQKAFQVIVLEHAGVRVWSGLPNVHLVEEWRGEVDLLIPRSWLE